jgi:hypothetical protein
MISQIIIEIDLGTYLTCTHAQRFYKNFKSKEIVKTLTLIHNYI